MFTELPSIGHLTICRRTNGDPVHVIRSPDEVVFLAFNTQIKRLVELHLLNRGLPIESMAKHSFFERAEKAADVRGPSFMRILEVGEDQRLVYYTSNLIEGEFVSDYVDRRGALPPATVFSLLLQLIDDLMLLSDRQRLLSQIRLDRAMVSTLEDTFLHLRLYDFGLSVDEFAKEDRSEPLVQLCELMFLLLTGKSYAGENPDNYQAVTSLPMNLRITLRSALVDPDHVITSTERLRDEVREAFGAFVSSIQARSPRKQLIITAALQPLSQLQDLLLEGHPVEQLLGNNFRAIDEVSISRFPFSIPCLNLKNAQPVTVHLLPPSRLVEKTQYEAVPLQNWRFDHDRHPNILRSLSLWESPDWSFLTEEHEPGFTLSRLLTERLTLNPSEVAIILRQVIAGLDQSLECGVARLELHPSNIFLRVGKAGPLLSREYERLMEKRLDVWPAFTVKLRAHLTMRHLYESPFVELPNPQDFDDEAQVDREYRNRAFVALAAYLLTGVRQAADAPLFPEALPEAICVFIRETLEQTRLQGHTLTPQEFLQNFEFIMSGPAVPDLAARLRGSNIALEEMESVGSVSDFDETDSDEDISPISRRLHAHEFDQRKIRSSPAWPVWAAAALVILGFTAWWMLPNAAPASTEIAQPKAAEKKAPLTQLIATIAAPQPPKLKPQAVETVASTPPTSAPVIVKPAPVPVKSPSPPPLPSVTATIPVTIRRALLPTTDEIAHFKQSQINPQPSQAALPAPQMTGALPTMNMASPLGSMQNRH